MKNLLKVLVCLCLSVPVFGQMVTVSGSNLTDSSGNAVSNATITFTPTLLNGQPIGFRKGTSGGQATATPVSATVTAGAFSLTVADTALTSPTNVCYNVTVTDNVTGNNLLGKGYGCVQPASTGISAASWCALSGAVTVCNFDTYTPNLSAQVATEAGPVGPTGPPLQFLGTWSATTTYQFGATISFNNVVYISLINANTGNNPSSSPADWAILYASPITGIINVSSFGGVDICAKINAAALANPGTILDARQFDGIQPCASNPFASTTGDIVVLLNNVTIQTKVPWVTNSAFNALIFGAGRGSNGRGTTIQAGTGFPATCDGLSVGCPILRLGNGTAPTFGNRIENLTLDCNGLAGCIGLYSNEIQEQSGARHFQVINFPVYGIFMDGTGGPGIGAENYVLEDGELYAANAGTSSTIGILITSNLASSNGPRLLSNLTANGAAGHIILSSYMLQGVTSGVLQGLNAESAVTGYTIGPNGSQGSQALSLDSVQCNVVSTTCVWLQSAVNDISIRNILNGGLATPTTLKDDSTGTNLTDFTVALYVIGSGGTFRINSGGIGSQLFKGLSVINKADAVLNVTLGSGVTASQGQTIIFADRNTNKWNIANTNANAFQIFDYANNFTRLAFDAAGNVSLNSFGAQAVLINDNPGSGSGGLLICTGGATPACPTSIGSSGVTTIQLVPGSITTPTGSCTGVTNGTLALGQDGHAASCVSGTWTSRW
jgi:hypothetical protein